MLYIQNVFKLSKINLFYAEKKKTQFCVPPKNPLLVTSFAPVSAVTTPVMKPLPLNRLSEIWHYKFQI